MSQPLVLSSVTGTYATRLVASTNLLYDAVTNVYSRASTASQICNGTIVYTRMSGRTLALHLDVARASSKGVP